MTKGTYALKCCPFAWIKKEVALNSHVNSVARSRVVTVLKEMWLNHDLFEESLNG